MTLEFQVPELSQETGAGDGDSDGASVAPDVVQDQPNHANSPLRGAQFIYSTEVN